MISHLSYRSLSSLARSHPHMPIKHLESQQVKAFSQPYYNITELLVSRQSFRQAPAQPAENNEPCFLSAQHTLPSSDYETSHSASSQEASKE
jgi:hypothetical protein